MVTLLAGALWLSAAVPAEAARTAARDSVAPPRAREQARHPARGSQAPPVVG